MSVVKQELGLFPCSLPKDHPPLTVVAKKFAVINEIAQIVNIILILQQFNAEQCCPPGECANTFPLCHFSHLLLSPSFFLNMRWEECTNQSAESRKNCWVYLTPFLICPISCLYLCSTQALPSSASSSKNKSSDIWPLAPLILVLRILGYFLWHQWHNKIDWCH